MDATFSLAAEVLSSRGGAAFAAADSSTSLSDDTVSRRVLELFLHQMRTGRLGGGEVVTLPSYAGLTTPPGPRTAEADSRFAGVAVPSGRTVRVLTRVDHEDSWTLRFLDIFREGLTETDSKYTITEATGAEVGTIRQAIDLLSRLVPHVASSVLSHLSYVGVVAGAGAFESASDRKAPRAIFINRDALTDVPRTSEAILHECVHQKLYDIQLVQPIYRAGYDAKKSAVVRPTWHKDAAWSFDRALAASHVYVHLSAFYASLECSLEPATSHVDAAGGRARTTGRARFLLDAVAGLPAESGPAGLRFISWLNQRLEHIEAGASTAPQIQGVK
ncbi:aKG-HExxH-type peptide beta-hydroxylase [Streptomyces virginiae]|uniref:aKG-HExxH-type peptide beta-hydroxylase n=1 Tax=Streptomyces virginiae TaxID=1961 RepID=UPI002253CBCB|nr:HEXXH motif-containing putative peptide modification protein [Streptomyces virginiae]MCX5178441.1 HEXXH motif-containing putative peptide modification protein [Streptomyces virginiae]